MRGVLLDQDLWVMAVTTLIARPFVTVVDDGHAMPYAQAFEWPDGSQGMAIRLEEDGAGLPTLVEMTHVASGRKVEIVLPFSNYLSTHSGATKTFPTIDDMLADENQTWSFGECQNGNDADGIYSTWKQLPEDTTMTENGVDVRTRATGRLVLRTFVRVPS